MDGWVRVNFVQSLDRALAREMEFRREGQSVWTVTYFFDKKLSGYRLSGLTLQKMKKSITFVAQRGKTLQTFFLTAS